MYIVREVARSCANVFIIFMNSINEEKQQQKQNQQKAATSTTTQNAKRNV